MTKYRIGRIEGDWVNFTPPIRGGIYREDGEETEASLDDSDDTSADWSSSLESWNSSTTSLDSNYNAELGKPPSITSHTTKGPEGFSSSIDVPDCQVEPRYNSSFAPTVECKHLTEDSALFVPTSPQGYISSAEQEIINNNIRDNPSLDAETQRMVTVKYQRLHQRVKDEGFYDCNYLEYGKEVVRYTILFTLFIACLRAEWYKTSALFLGLFWVSPLALSNTFLR
jgi:delta8-fatty-acid desaturase